MHSHALISLTEHTQTCIHAYTFVHTYAHVQSEVARPVLLAKGTHTSKRVAVGVGVNRARLAELVHKQYLDRVQQR